MYVVVMMCVHKEALRSLARHLSRRSIHPSTMSRNPKCHAQFLEISNCSRSKFQSLRHGAQQVPSRPSECDAVVAHLVHILF